VKDRTQNYDAEVCEEHSTYPMSIYSGGADFSIKAYSPVHPPVWIWVRRIVTVAFLRRVQIFLLELTTCVWHCLIRIFLRWCDDITRELKRPQ